MPNDTLKTLEAAERQIEQRLMAESQDFRAYVGLRRLIAELTGGTPPSMAADVGVTVMDFTGKIAKTVAGRSPSQVEAVEQVLGQFGPQPTNAILQKVIELGAHVGGSDPLINLSSAISKSGKFDSVRINGIRHWWFKGQELPNTRVVLQEGMDFGGSTGADTPAADSSNKEGGEDGDAAA